MKVWQLFNRYRESVNGEEYAVLGTHELLNDRGVQSQLVTVDSGSVVGPARKLGAAAGSVYSRAAYRRVRSALRSDRPDVVHAHNLLPLFSPSVLKACRDESIPVVVTVHNYFLTCPIYTHYVNGRQCDACVDNSEVACVLKNCRGNISESAVYAFRTWVARRFRLYLENANAVIALTRFARERLIDYGFEPDKIEVVPNFSPLEGPGIDVRKAEYAAYAGRLNAAKGLDTLVESAGQTEIPVRIAGSGLRPARGESVDNIEYVGLLDRQQMLEFYRGAGFVVVPSRWYEMCPLVILEAMSLGLPVIAADVGGLPEFVVDGETGLLFQAGDADQLARQMQRLWFDVELRVKLGAAARRKARIAYSADAHFLALSGVYSRLLGEQRN